MKKTIALLVTLIFLTCNIKIISQNYFAKNNLHLDLTEGHLIISKSGIKLVEIVSINFNFTPPKSISFISSEDKEIKLKCIYPAVAEYREKGRDLIDTVIISRLENGLMIGRQQRKI